MANLNIKGALPNSLSKETDEIFSSLDLLLPTPPNMDTEEHKAVSSWLIVGCEDYKLILESIESVAVILTDMGYEVLRLEAEFSPGYVYKDDAQVLYKASGVKFSVKNFSDK